MAVLLTATAPASVVDIPANTTGHVYMFPDGYQKPNGELRFAYWTYPRLYIWHSYLKFDLASLSDTCPLVANVKRLSANLEPAW